MGILGSPYFEKPTICCLKQGALQETFGFGLAPVVCRISTRYDDFHVLACYSLRLFAVPRRDMHHGCGQNQVHAEIQLQPGFAEHPFTPWDLA